MSQAICHQCGHQDDIVYMWDDGPDGHGDTLYLCQECHEAEVDKDFWETVTAHPDIWREP